MSKLTKLVRHPLSFLQDAYRNQVNPQAKEAELEAKAQKKAAFEEKKAILAKQKAALTKETKTTKSKGKVTVAQPVTVEEKPESAVPAWFQSDIGPELRRAFAGSKPVFLYIPWIAEHGNMLIDRIADNKTYTLAGLDFIRGVEDNELRRGVLRFARANPHLYRRMIARRLVPLRNRVSGIIFTFDWAPVMRIIASVCEELDIPRILIPHESVFVDREKYYWDPTAQASIPVADVTLGWGGMQREIFLERGYPAHRFQAVGAPKFDPYKNYKPQLSRAQYCRLFGLDPAKKIIIFASQPLDSQLNIKIARKCQCDAIGDLLDIAEAKGMQLVVRLPPSKDNILEPALQKRMERSSAAVIDDALCYLVSPEEALYHADLVTSVNSTMLFEGLLIGRPPLSVKYVAFDSIWAQAGIPAANNKEELIKLVDEILFSGKKWEPSPEGVAWAAGMFSNGEFDGKANVRIRDYLRGLAEDKDQLTIRPGALERIFARNSKEGNVNLIGSILPEKAWETTHKYLMPMLKARARLDTSKGLEDIRTLASIDVFVQTGSKPHIKQSEVQAALGRSKVVVEPGFLPSVPGIDALLSIYIDDTTSHADATQASRLQRRLESSKELSKAQLLRARKAISTIVRHRISQNNSAPYLPLSMGKPGRTKTLIVDQPKSDKSLPAGLADPASFQQMLQSAAAQGGNERDLLVQLPPNLKSPSDSYLANLDYINNLFPVKFDVHPYALIGLADDVYVVNSLIGFDALLAGKTVHCFGAPFYAGWGVTKDHVKIPGRTRQRSVEEIFFFAYIDSSRYFHPELNQVVEIEQMLEYIIAHSGQSTPVDPEPVLVEEEETTPVPVAAPVEIAPVPVAAPVEIATPVEVVEVVTPAIEVLASEDKETDLDEIEQVEQDELDLPKLGKDADFDQAEDADLDLSELPKETDLDLTEQEKEAEQPEPAPAPAPVKTAEPRPKATAARAPAATLEARRAAKKKKWFN